MTNEELLNEYERYVNKYTDLKHKIQNTNEYIDIVIEELSNKLDEIQRNNSVTNMIETYIQILELIKEGLK